MPSPIRRGRINKRRVSWARLCTRYLEPSLELSLELTLGPAVDHPLGLALRAFDRARLDDAHARGHADESLDVMRGARAEPCALHGVEPTRELAARLDHDLKLVETVR